ncbi:MAG: ABC transporter ATP-binding protein [Gemmatimonadota bacterium]|jgi:ABC-type multidrug transport system ATPase subunit
MTDCLLADSVGKRFGDRRVLTAATLHVPVGRITALLGRNGCGKTTLLRILTGFLSADWGRIEVLGRHVLRPSMSRLAHLGFFFLPDRDLLARQWTVRQHFEILGRRFGMTDASEAIAIAGIAPFLDRTPRQLSGGERRRAEVALALFREPACLIADEPFNGIAPKDADTVAAALRALAARGCAILATGHEVEILLDTADTVVWMVAGTTYPLGVPAEARKHHAFIRDYLGPHGVAIS